LRFAAGVRGGGEAAGEPPAERGVRAKMGDCEAAEAAGEPAMAGSRAGVRGGLALGCDMVPVAVRL